MAIKGLIYKWAGRISVSMFRDDREISRAISFLRSNNAMFVEFEDKFQITLKRDNATPVVNVIHLHGKEENPQIDLLDGDANAIVLNIGSDYLDSIVNLNNVISFKPYTETEKPKTCICKRCKRDTDIGIPCWWCEVIN